MRLSVQLILVCSLALLPRLVAAAPCPLAWMPPTTYVDGSPIDPDDIVQYELWQHLPGEEPVKLLVRKGYIPWAQVPDCIDGATYTVIVVGPAGLRSAPSAPYVVQPTGAASQLRKVE